MAHRIRAGDRPAVLAGVILVAGAAIIVPLLHSEYALYVATQLCIYYLVALGLNVSFGEGSEGPYCLIGECYPDGAVAADNPISTDRLCIVVFQARSMGGAVGGSGPT
jgi:hypothetical protein